MTSHSVDPALPADDPTGIVTDHEIAGILQDARNGDPNAAEALFRHLQPRMLSVALKQVTGHADAEDAVADAWEAIYRELTDFAGPPHHWLSRAFSITRNRAIDLRRHNDRHVTRQVDELVGMPSSEDTAATALRRLAIAAVLHHIRDLPEAEARALTARRIHGLTTEEAASLLNQTHRALHTATSRATRKLRDMAATQGLTTV